MDLRNDPILVYESLLDHSPPMIDFLLPHANWSRPPPRPANPGNAVPYASWLIEVFEWWYNAPRRETRVGLFESIIGSLVGVPRTSEQVGFVLIRAVVVEADGTIEQVDVLQVRVPGSGGHRA